MKTIRFTAFSILFGLLVLVSACKKETKPVAASQTGSKIMVTGQDAGTGLKTSIIGQTTFWVAGDKVGIYSADARTTSGGAIAIVNAPFTAGSNAASSTFSGTMFWGAAAPTPHTFYAYYPYKAGSFASTAVPVSLASAQTQSAADNSDHIGALDFLVATPVTVNSPGIAQISNTEVHLSYNHLFTVLEFQIKGSGPLKAVKLVGTSNPVAFSGGTIDLNQTPTAAPYAIADQTGTTTQAVVTLANQATLDATTATTVYMVINPGIQTGNCSIELSQDGTNWTSIISKPAPSEGFLRGKKYVVSVDAATASNIGDSYQGGKIFYFLQPGDPGYVSGEIHGLIAATVDQSTGIQWYNGSYTSTGAIGTELGTGGTNTTAIITSQGNTGSYAAKICRDYTDGVYHDWYLPSKDELNKLYLQQSAVGGFANYIYWNSTEISWNTSFASTQSFSDGTQPNYIKSNWANVRAIRVF